MKYSGMDTALESELFTFYLFSENLVVISVVDRVHVDFMKASDIISMNECVSQCKKKALQLRFVAC